MPEDWKRALERRLADVPRGEVLIRAASGAPLFPPPACACIGRDEKGRLDIYNDVDNDLFNVFFGLLGLKQRKQLRVADQAE